MTTLYKFKAYFTDAGVGTVQDPAPTCTVINMADDSKVADAQATTASTNMPGLYSYEYSGADGLDCVAFFATTDTGCDVKQLASYVSEKITTNLNADVAGVETKVDAIDTIIDNIHDTDLPAVKSDTAAILADTGTDGVVLKAAGLADDAVNEIVDQVWDEAIAGHAIVGSTGAGLSAAGSVGDPWSTALPGTYGAGTAGLALSDILAKTDQLDVSSTSFVTAVSGSTITILRGDTLSADLLNLGSLASYVSLDFTVKRSTYEADDDAIIRIRKNASGLTDGLVRLNGAAWTTGTDGSITITDAPTGDITIMLKAGVTDDLVPGSYVYDIQLIGAAGVKTLTTGGLVVTADVTRLVA